MLPDPVIAPFYFGPFLMYPFGILVGLGILAGWYVLMWRAKLTGLRTDIAGWVVVIGFVCGTVSSHLFDVLFYHPQDILTDPWILLNIPAGLSSFGSFLGAFASGIVFLRLKRQPFWPYADAVMWCFLVGWAFGRMGCTVAFDHPGPLTDSFWGMPYHGPLATPGVRHNMGFYEVPWALLLALFFWVRRNRPHFAGFITLVIALAYLPMRFLLDFLREGEPDYFGLSAGQWEALLLLVPCVWLYVARRRKNHLVIPGASVHLLEDGTPLPQRKAKNPPPPTPAFDAQG